MPIRFPLTDEDKTLVDRLLDDYYLRDALADCCSVPELNHTRWRLQQLGLLDEHRRPTARGIMINQALQDLR